MGLFGKLQSWGRALYRPFQQNALARLLDRLKGATTMQAKVLWLRDWAEWLRTGQIPPEFLKASEPMPSARLRYFMETITRQAEWRELVSTALHSILTQTHGLELFCQTGMNEEGGFLAELINRTLKRFLPVKPQWDDFAYIFSTVFSQKNDPAWIKALQPQIVGEVVKGIERSHSDSGANFAPLKHSTADALLVLSAQLLALSQEPELRRRRPLARIDSTPFFQLNLTIQNLATQVKTGQSESAQLSVCEQLISECHEDIRKIYSHLEGSGVSISLVYSLEHQSHILRRLDSLLILLLTPDLNRFFSTLIRFAAELVTEHFETQSIRTFIGQNIHLLSRKVAERTGVSGEHYITKTRREYFSMINSAAGGGFLTVGTTYIKLATVHLALAPFLEGILIWTDYSGSFILMQLLGFTLASKQPSMTAATLAGKLKAFSHGHAQFEYIEFVDEVAMIARSQLASALGNLGAAIPIALCADMISKMVTHHSVVHQEKAISIIQSLDPLHSLTLPFAAFTGVLLWLSSLCAGWFENWVVLHQVPEAIEYNPRLNSLFGRPFSKRVADWFSHQVSGFAGNISVGFLLAFAPVLGSFFGLPLDVRHVTLSATTLTLAACSLGPAISAVPLGAAVSGIFCILVLNVSVSFLLALLIAAKARNIPGLSPWPIIKPIIQGFAQSPGRFFFPRRDRTAIQS